MKQSRQNSPFFLVFEWLGPCEIRLQRDYLKTDLQKVWISTI